MKNLFLLFFLVALFSCEEPTNTIDRFTIYYGKDSIDAKIEDTVITALVPFGVSRDSLVVKYDDSAVVINAQQPVSMFGYTVIIKSFTGIPILYLNTNAPIESKETYVTGEFRVDGNASYPDFLQTMQIRGRGNSTWGQPKKPYKVKLDSKTSVMGMPEDKDWNLLANYLDKTLIRTDVAFELGERIGLGWNPRRRFVEVILNGQYNGQYLLTESVKVGKDRLDIVPMSKSDTAGCWLIEANYLQDEKTNFTSNGVKFSLKEPETLSANQLKHVKGTMDRLAILINDYGDLSTMIDVDSWIKWTIVQEFMRNRDGLMNGSCYFYKKMDGKVAAGPLWDFDLSSGAYGVFGDDIANSPEGWYVNNANYLEGMFKYNDAYKARYKEIWNQHRDQLSSIDKYIDSINNVLHLSIQENYRRWSNLSTIDYDGQYNGGAYAEHLKDFFKKRFAFMDAEIQKL